MVGSVYATIFSERVATLYSISRYILWLYPSGPIKYSIRHAMLFALYRCSGATTARRGRSPRRGLPAPWAALTPISLLLP
jgi:hypothetical protein